MWIGKSYLFNPFNSLIVDFYYLYRKNQIEFMFCTSDLDIDDHFEYHFLTIMASIAKAEIESG